ncbi:MAG: hypothetical protein KTR24_11325 [Saprospiraceae bacterium]|nr:hypothetical protein [Saprospiraceae bacterium]
MTTKSKRQDGSKRSAAGANGGYLVRSMPYFFFLLVLVLVYIGNAHYVERKMRLIDQKKKEIKELNWIYMSSKSDMLQEATYSRLAEQVQQYQLTTKGPLPLKISKDKQ